MNTLYTIGYTGRSLDELAELANRHKAGIVDVRYSDGSQSPKWRGKSLQKSMEFRGVHYAHIPDLGNINYGKPGPQEIANPQRGCYALAALLELAPQVILCACPDPHLCHRSIVAQLMKNWYDVDFIHLGEKSSQANQAGAQRELF